MMGELSISSLKTFIQIDHFLLQKAHRLRRIWLTRFMLAVTQLGDTINWVFVVGILALIGGEAGIIAWLAGTSGILAILFSQFIKRIARRKRPSVLIPEFNALIENPDLLSFPSGHMSAATAIAVAVSTYNPQVGGLLLILALGIGLSRVYLGAHFPLDVVAGLLVGLFTGLFTPFLLSIYGLI